MSVCVSARAALLSVVVEWELQPAEAEFSPSSSSGSTTKARLLGSWTKIEVWTLSLLGEVA